MIISTIPSSLCVFLLSAFLSLQEVQAQAIHTVTVGAAGSFYDPATISAALNDTVRFLFEGPTHGVIQCAFENPCFPLTGGFSSGFAGRGDNLSLPTPQWDLQITNVSHPIWFYCANTKPVSHCASGMVGVINPPSIEMYNQFRMAAEAVTVTPSVGPPVVTSAPDAFATNSPLPVSTTSSVVITLAPSSSSSSQVPTSDIPTSSATPIPIESHSHSQKGAAIGGAVGGVAAFILVALLVLCVFYRRRRRRSESRDFFQYTARSPDLGSNVFTPAKLTIPPPNPPIVSQFTPSTMRTKPYTPVTFENPQSILRNNSISNQSSHDTGVQVSNSSTISNNDNSAKSQAATESASRRPIRALPLPGPVVLDHKDSAGSLSVGSRSRQERDSVNIQVLAKEVAAVLMQGGPPAQGSSARTAGNDPSREFPHHTESPAPPRYHPS